MGLVNKFIAVCTLVGNAVSVSAQVACVNDVCTNTGRISSSDPLPADAYRIENGRNVLVRPGRIEPVQPGVRPWALSRPTPGRFAPITPVVPYSSFDPNETRDVDRGTPVQPYAVTRFPVLEFENEKGVTYCHLNVLDDSRPRNTQSLCVDFSNALGKGTPITIFPNPFVRQVTVGHNQFAFCRSDSKFGQSGQTTSLNVYAVYPARSQIDCILFGY